MNEEVKLMKGNDALALAAIRYGADGYFGYPITPQSEVLECLEAEMPWETTGMVVLQAESEVAAINMVYAGASCGKAVMTSTSSPGFSLMQEGVSYIAASEVPALLVNVMRGGPGLGTIHPSQADYFQATKGGGHGDYHMIVLAPSSVQEMADFVGLGWDLAFKYRCVSIILADGLIGQMMEPVEFNYVPRPNLPEKKWALVGHYGAERSNIKNLVIEPDECEAWNHDHFKVYDEVVKNEQAWEEYMMDDAEYAFVSYGTASRVVRTAIGYLRAAGFKVGMIRPKTLWPFPQKAFDKWNDKIKKFLDVEMSMGQMVPDVAYACNDRNKVAFHGRTGGNVPTVDEIVEFGKEVMGGDK